MYIISSIYRIILESLFPLSDTDKELFSYSPEKAWQILPPAPKLPISNTFSIFAYKNPVVTRLVWNIKYKKSAKAVQIGGYALWKWKWGQPPFPENRARPLFSSDHIHTSSLTRIIPIPITTRRRKERGYNQCELLLDEIKRLDVENRYIACKDLLERVQHLDRQTLKNREQRLESAKGIFAVNETVASPIEKGTPMIVIDDVITTGSTIKEAIETLEKAGFKNVIGLSLAH